MRKILVCGVFATSFLFACSDEATDDSGAVFDASNTTIDAAVVDARPLVDAIAPFFDAGPDATPPPDADLTLPDAMPPPDAGTGPNCTGAGQICIQVSLPASAPTDYIPLRIALTGAIAQPVLGSFGIPDNFGKIIDLAAGEFTKSQPYTIVLPTNPLPNPPFGANTAFTADFYWVVTSYASASGFAIAPTDFVYVTPAPITGLVIDGPAEDLGDHEMVPYVAQ